MNSDSTFPDAHHKRWAKNRQRIYGGQKKDYLDLIVNQSGRCVLSGAPLFFDSVYGGGSVRGGKGCHPLYAALDHCAPGSNCSGFQIVCYALNDLKGHLPLDCFRDLQQTAAWQRLMRAWCQQAEIDPSSPELFRQLLRSQKTD